MTGGVKFWAATAFLLSLSILDLAFAHFDDIPCKGETISVSQMKDDARKCRIEWPKGRSVKKDCQPSCIQKEVGWINARLQPVTDKSAIVAAMAKNYFPEKIAQEIVDLVFKNNCAAVFQGDATCQSHLEFGECIVMATIEVCELPAESIETFRKDFKPMYDASKD